MGAVHAKNFTEELYLVKGPGQLRVGPPRYSDDKTEVQYSYWKIPSGPFNKKSPREVISFRARPLPGCCGILVLYYVRLSTIDGGNTLFTSAIDAAIQASKNAGYASVVMSLLDTSKEALDIVKAKGFVASAPMINKKTDNSIVTLQLDLHQEPKQDKKVFVAE